MECHSRLPTAQRGSCFCVSLNDMKISYTMLLWIERNVGIREWADWLMALNVLRITSIATWFDLLQQCFLYIHAFVCVCICLYVWGCVFSQIQSFHCLAITAAGFLLIRHLCALYQNADAFPVKLAEPSHPAPHALPSSPPQPPPPVSMVGSHSNSSLCSACITGRFLHTGHNKLQTQWHLLYAAVCSALLCRDCTDKSGSLSLMYTWIERMNAQCL